MKRCSPKTVLHLILFLVANLNAEESKTVKRLPLPPADVIAQLPPDGGEEFNRLVFETSPYLRQHARNPVDWYPWGPEAFAKARAEDKPVFLSVGYSACHWCHVMEHESFEDDQVARLLNEHFVSIKVDREERPDVDAIYITATQMMTGHGGWPNTVFMDHGKRPFFCGTYFPKSDQRGRPGFVSVLHQLKDVWKDRRHIVDQQAARMAEALESVAARTHTGESIPDDKLVATVLQAKTEGFDAVQGGFGGAPKFPPHQSLLLMLTALESGVEEPGNLTEMLTLTLDKMALGGIHDHIGGGFHRYATDAIWFLPHFEKMLYDNAQLAEIYSRAALILKTPRYRRIAEDICDWVLRDMRDAHGGFHSALDADSEGEEGKFYLWSRADVLELLGAEDGAWFADLYQISEDGNYVEEATGKRFPVNIPFLKQFPDSLSPEDQARLAKLTARLRDARAKRIWPGRDDKVLSGWNGLMISALAQAGKGLDRPDYLQAAREAADFILQKMMQDGKLLRSYRAGEARIPAYLEDYSFLALGLIELHAATGEGRWKDAALSLLATLDRDFKDTGGGGGYFFTGHDYEALLTREKDPFDNATPSGNGIAAKAWARLHQLTGKPEYADAAREITAAFNSLISQAPQACGTLVESVLRLPAIPAAAHRLGEISEDPVTAWIVLSAEPAKAEDFRQAELVIDIKPHWHVWPNPPPVSKLDVPFIPTAVQASGKQTRLQPVTWPQGKDMSFELLGETLPVYEGTIRVPISFQADTPEVRLTLTWQACDDKGTCKPPVNKEMSFLLQ